MKIALGNLMGVDKQNGFVWVHADIDGETVALRMTYGGLRGLDTSEKLESADDYLARTERFRDALAGMAKERFAAGQTLISRRDEVDYLWLL
ncbi:MAG: hypothetical protein KDD75_23130 [Caldilineaceae bacterium]|nr:hypothetical protein [Caldilineaceae bacterium]